LIRIATLLSGHSLAAMLTLARNLLLAHMLGPAQYAMAVTVVIVTAAAEMVTTLGLAQLIISHKSGATRRLQATLHAFQLAKGALGASLVFLSAGPLANALGAPELAPTLRYAALVPLILGTAHLDPFRMQRHQRHTPQIAVLSLPALVAFGLLWPLSHLLRGPELMLLLLLIQAGMTVVTSHMVAARGYRVKLGLPQVPLVLKYGLPLAANGALMFAILHAEKLIAGMRLGLSDMGLLAMGFTLTLTPALICARSFQAYHLPRLRGQSHNVLGVSFLFAAALMAGMALAVPLALPVLGAGFQPIAALVPLLACIAATRLPKSALATAALASGRTSLPAWANLPRLLALPVTWVLLAQGGSMQTLLVIALTAELAGLALGAYLARHRDIPHKQAALALIVATLVLAGQPMLAAAACALGWLLAARKIPMLQGSKAT